LSAVPAPVRFNSDDDLRDRVPVFVVWELTLACNLKCVHCGSRAGRPRPRELTTDECLDVVRRLAAMGTRAVTLIGGEAYLRPDWTEVVREIRRHGIDCTVQSGARNLTDARLAAAVEAGLQGLGVSLDGPPELHDRIRGVAGSYDQAISALRRAKAAGLRTSVNTTIGAATPEHLPELLERIAEAGVTHWQLQLVVAMGNAVDNEELLLQPHRMLDLMPLLAELHHAALDRDVLLMTGNNIGYFGPFEHLWRSHVGEAAHWSGCTAGQTVLALESDGTVKGCPSLATAGHAAGNVREWPLESLWEASELLRRPAARGASDLWGFCATCYYAPVCRGGCTWMADSLFGRPGNNPYCHYRALELARRGLRERVVKVRDAPRGAFTTGEFALVTEELPGVVADRAAPPSPPPAAATTGREAPALEPCRSCQCFVYRGERICPHCGADVARAAAAWEDDAKRRADLVAEVERWIAAAESRSRSIPAAAQPAATGSG
jgi:Y-X(10)_GDL-associated radical SAM protein